MANHLKYLAGFIGLIVSSQSFSASPASITIPLPQTSISVATDGQGSAVFSGGPCVGNSGFPGLPLQKVTALLPPDADVSTVMVSIQNQLYETVPGSWDVLPIPPLMGGDGSGLLWPNASQIVNGRDIQTYSTNAWYPSTNLMNFSSGRQREWQLADVFIFPYQYNPVTKSINHLASANIVITYALSNKTAPVISNDNLSAETMQKVANKTINFSSISSLYVPALSSGSALALASTSMQSAVTGIPSMAALATSPSHYVIITTNAIKNIASKLPDFISLKQAQGFAVEVITEDLWGGGTGNIASENIRNWLKNNYLGHKIQYVLLIGNPDPIAGDVPMKAMYPEGYPGSAIIKDYPTDFYYAELTGNWDLNNNGIYGELNGDIGPGGPETNYEVVVGRIPYYGSSADLNNILSKITSYENAAVAAQSWRSKTLLPMYPLLDTLHDNSLGYPLGEEIKDLILTPNNYSYYRVYKQAYSLVPPPEQLGVSFDNVTNAWNAVHPGTVFYRGLGFFAGNQITVSNIMDVNHAALLNPSYPAFVFGCSSFDASPEKTDNISYSLLKTGAFLTIGATRLSIFLSDQNSNYAHQSYNTGICFDYAQQILHDVKAAGSALQDVKTMSLADAITFENYMTFNVYGDPSAKINTTQTPPNLAFSKAFSASSINSAATGPEKAFDGAVSTQWTAAAGKTVNEWLQIDFGMNTTFNKIILSENGAVITGYKIQTWNGTAWVDAYTGTTIGAQSTITLASTVGSKARILITSANQAPSINEFEIYNIVIGASKVSGATFGSAPPYTSGFEFDKASDGNIATYFDYSQANGGYTGIDLSPQNVAKIVKIRFYPRVGYEGRMNGGKFQGSNTSSSAGYVDLATIATTPASAQWTELTVTDQNTYRYLRYLGPAGSFCNIAEMEFYKESVMQQTLSSIALSPASIAVNGNATQQFSAIAKDQYGNAIYPQPAFAWSVGAGGGSINSTGLYTAANSAGTFTITALSGSISGTASVTVNPTLVTGSISYEKWTGITGTSTDNIPLTTTPNQTGKFTSFEAPSNIGDNYGYRVRGYLVAPQTGTYYFWIASDDNSKLFLNASGSSSSGKQLIASVTGWTNSREWNKFTTQKSCAINLTAGSIYYIEALMKESTTNDNLAVGWAKPGQNCSAPSEVIPGSALAPWPSPITLEAENLSRTSNVSTVIDYESGCSNGQEVRLNGAAKNDYVQLTLPNIPAGTYSIKVYYKSNNNCAMAQASFDGVNQGSVIDQYCVSVGYQNVHDLGVKTFSSTGNKVFKYTVTGKNAKSSCYTITVDKIVLSLQ
jgi:hypothetical protein